MDWVAAEAVCGLWCCGFVYSGKKQNFPMRGKQAALPVMSWPSTPWGSLMTELCVCWFIWTAERKNKRPEVKTSFIALPFCILPFRMELSTVVLRGVWAVWGNGGLLIWRYRTVRAQSQFEPFPAFGGSCEKLRAIPFFLVFPSACCIVCGGYGLWEAAVGEALCRITLMGPNFSVRALHCNPLGPLQSFQGWSAIPCGTTGP